MSAKSTDTIIISELKVIGNYLNPIRAWAVYEAARQLEQLKEENHKLRNAVASILCADEPGRPTLAEAKKACVEALKEATE